MGQFKDLVESAEKDQPLQESLRRALNLTAKVRRGLLRADRHMPARAFSPNRADAVAQPCCTITTWLTSMERMCTTARTCWTLSGRAQRCGVPHAAPGEPVPARRIGRAPTKVLDARMRQGWEGARKHALRAVTTDNFMRIWVADDSLTTGLLFRCSLGRTLMDAPVCARSAPACARASSHPAEMPAPAGVLRLHWRTCQKRAGRMHTMPMLHPLSPAAHAA